LNELGAITGFEDEAWKYLWSKRRQTKHQDEDADRVLVRMVIS
jgi:hypothetical protein